MRGIQREARPSVQRVDIPALLVIDRDLGQGLGAGQCLSRQLQAGFGIADAGFSQELTDAVGGLGNLGQLALDSIAGARQYGGF